MPLMASVQYKTALLSVMLRNESITNAKILVGLRKIQSIICFQNTLFVYVYVYPLFYHFLVIVALPITIMNDHSFMQVNTIDWLIYKRVLIALFVLEMVC